jgi:hypothetical protein
VAGTRCALVAADEPGRRLVIGRSHCSHPAVHSPGMRGGRGNYVATPHHIEHSAPVGWFSRFRPSSSVPRWGFRIGWADFVAQAHDIAGQSGTELDENVLRALADACRDLEPHAWSAQIRKSLDEILGRRDARLEPPIANEFRRTLRVQMFGREYFTTLNLPGERLVARPFGDAWLAVVQDAIGAEVSTTRDDLARDGISVAQAFALGQMLGVSDTASQVQNATLGVAGATIDIAVTNAFYLSAVMLEAQAKLPADSAIVACPVSWHHWVLATLERRTATRDTLRAIADVVDKLGAGIQVAAAERIGSSLWWWPPGQDPDPFTPDGTLPHGLASALRSA